MTKYGNPLALYIAAGPAGGGSTTADINIYSIVGTGCQQRFLGCRSLRRR